MVKHRCPGTGDLLSWEPEEPVVAFVAHEVRAASLKASLAKAVAAALKGRDREEVAEAMSAYLGERVSKDVIDKYASEAAEDHVITMVRFMALVHVTKDQRLMQLLAETMGWVVIEERWLPAIREAQYAEKIEQLERERRASRKGWTGGRS